jgi:hypothetical protein
MKEGLYGSDISGLAVDTDSGGLGFALHLLWIVAAIVLVFWLVGFTLGRGHAEGTRGWYRW